MYVIAIGKNVEYFKATGWVTFTRTDITNATKFRTKNEAQDAIKLNGITSSFMEVKVVEVSTPLRNI
jgi:hypothetical protein